MRTTRFFLFAGIFFLTLTGSHALGAVDVELKSVDTVEIGDTFDVEIRMSGSDMVLNFDLLFNFDKDKIQIRSTTTEAEGMLSPSPNAIDTANSEGQMTLVYLDMALVGFSPGEDSLMATISCEALGSGNALFEIDDSSTISGTEFPQPNVTGNFTGKTVSIIDESSQTGYHSADYVPDFYIDISELLRVIQIYTYDTYHCDSTTEDGYAPGSGDQNCSPHNSDYNSQDWRIDLGELLRLIQIYSSSGGYEMSENTEDGFSPIQ